MGVAEGVAAVGLPPGEKEIEAKPERRFKMSLFGSLIGTLIEVVKLPVAVAKDVVTMGNVQNIHEDTYTEQALDKIKDEAQG